MTTKSDKVSLYMATGPLSWPREDSQFSYLCYRYLCTHWSCDVSADSVGLFQARKADTVGRNVARPTCAILHTFFCIFTHDNKDNWTVYLHVATKSGPVAIYIEITERSTMTCHSCIHNTSDGRMSCEGSCICISGRTRINQLLGELSCMYINPIKYIQFILYIRLLW